MGWKVSLIAGTTSNSTLSDEEILATMDLEKFKFKKESYLEECIDSPSDRVSIGRYQGKTIVCAPQRFLLRHFEDKSHAVDFLPLFSGSELVMTACHSATNYHAYALYNTNGEQVRFKSISADEEKEERGQVLESEQAIYQKAQQNNGKYVWANGGESYNEDQMMEVFTFGMLERVLGVNINGLNGESLLEDTPFKTYEVEFKKHYEPKKKKNTWLTYVIFLILFAVWQFLKRAYGW